MTLNESEARSPRSNPFTDIHGWNLPVPSRLVPRRLLAAWLALGATLSPLLSAATADADVAPAPAPPTGLKDPCRGLMTRQGTAPASMPFIDSCVVQLNWSDLEPADQQFTGRGWEEIEAARKHGGKIRLRILAGIHAPAFVKRLGGVALSDPEHKTDATKTGGVAIWNHHDERGGVACCFWLPEVLDHYEKLMREVARRYDDAPEIAEVVDSACMTVYAEPFYRAHTDAGSNARLWQAGLNAQKDRAAHERAIRIHQTVFQHTRTSLAINAWDLIDDSPSHHHNAWPPTYEFVEWAHQIMGPKLVLQNNGFGRDAAGMEKRDPSEHHFGYLTQTYGPKGFQTRTLSRLGGKEGDLYFVLEQALKMGANFIELPSGFQKFDAAKLRAFDERFEKMPIVPGPVGPLP